MKYTQPHSKFTEAQRWFYENNGYMLIKNNVDSAVLDKCRQRFIDICNAEPGAYNALVHKDPFLKTTGAKGQYLVNKDLHYFPFRPANGIVASWTAMEKIDERNGCLHVVPGSHLKGILYKHEYPEGFNKHSLYHGVQGMEHIPRVDVVMEKGDTLFFHPLLLHGSGPNLTKGFRKAISCHYADTNSIFIDVKGTSQERISNEILEISNRRGIKVSIADVWKIQSRLVRGSPGNFQRFDSHL